MVARKNELQPQAVVRHFEGGNADQCASIRRDVDAVLVDVSEYATAPTIPGNALLRLYVISAKIQFAHVVLNQALSHCPKFSPFRSAGMRC